MRLVEGDERADVEVREAVAVGHDEARTVLQVGAHAQQALPGGRFLTGVRERDLPALRRPGEALDPRQIPIAAEAQAQVGLQERRVVQEVVHDLLAAVAKGEDEVDQPVAREGAHDVVDERLLPDAEERLGERSILTRETNTLATDQQHDLHPVPPRPGSAAGVVRGAALC